MGTLLVQPNKYTANTAIPSSYVLLAATSTFLVNYAHSINTSRHRKLAKVPYPVCYAPDSRTDHEAYKFNCAQRSHANFIENQPSMLASLLLAGLRFPITAAIMGAGWSLGRYLYMTGYTRGDQGGKGRYQGIFYQLFQMGLMLLAGYNGVMMVLEK
jgi:glutathione S-transferase